MPEDPERLQPRPHTGDFLSLVKFEHTLFALPFALLSAFHAAGGIPSLPTLFWILVAMVGARSAAMAFNRIVDRRIDAANPRTATREIPAGKVSVGQAEFFCAAAAALFVVAAWNLNTLCLALSPVALAAVLVSGALAALASRDRSDPEEVQLANLGALPVEKQSDSLVVRAAGNDQ